MMYKQPSRRVKITRCNANVPQVGSFLYKILNPLPTQYPLNIKQPVYQQDDYLRRLQANNKRHGIPYVDPKLPIYERVVKPPIQEEPELTYGDRVQVTIRILKNGTVRVKINTAIAEMFSKYYSKYNGPNSKAPFKVILQAYKSHGFSKSFLDKMIKNKEKQKKIAIRVEKVFTKLFDKEPIKKVKKKKKQEEINEERPTCDGDGDGDVPPAPVEPEEEETLDIEPDEEEEEEEEYVSDGGE